LADPRSASGWRSPGSTVWSRRPKPWSGAHSRQWA